MDDLTLNNAIGNMAGFSKLGISPENEVQSINNVNNTQKNVIFASGGRWALIECDSIELSHNTSEGCYENKITCNYSGVRNVADSMLNKMKGQRFIARLKDRSGVFWLIGTKEEPLNFGYEHVGNATGEGAHTYRLSLSRKTTEPLFITN